jgi:hypothetical protein
LSYIPFFLRISKKIKKVGANIPQNEDKRSFTRIKILSIGTKCAALTIDWNDGMLE